MASLAATATGAAARTRIAFHPVSTATGGRMPAMHAGVRRPLSVAVVGATGVVGKTMIQVLIEREFPLSEIRLLASGKAAGRTIEYGGRQLPVGEATHSAFEGIDIALFSAGTDVSRELAPLAVDHGAVVIDNSNAWRMDAGVPLVVSQVNPADAALHEGIIANPNCSTMQLAPVLMALRDTVGIERVVVDTYQSVSGTGADAIAELEEQIQAHAAGRPKESAVYPHPIAFNALPEIDVFLENGYSREEWKVITENRKILHLPDLRISCTAVRVPVFAAHSEAVHVETREPITPDRARELFAAVPGVVVQDDPVAHVYPIATAAAGRDEIFVGRVRQDASIPDHRGLVFWVVSDNLRKGAATNAVEIAELLVANDWIARASVRAGAAAGAADEATGSGGVGATGGTSAVGRSGGGGTA
jgi:aspartate-semialdehyde dehydrogenase